MQLLAFAITINNKFACGSVNILPIPCHECLCWVHAPMLCCGMECGANICPLQLTAFSCETHGTEASQFKHNSF